MTRKICAGAVLIAAAVAFIPAWAGAAQTGAIKGRISDRDGRPLAGAYLYLASPAMPGISNYMTTKTGRFAFPLLPPGGYEVTVELPGYKTVTVKDIVVFAGATATVNIRMEASEIEEERTEARPGPGIDRESYRNAVYLDREVVTRVPGSRDFRSLLGLAPGLIFENDEGSDYRASTHGAPVTANAFQLDGVNVTDPVTGEPMGVINVDLIDHVVVETAAHPVEAGPSQGAIVHIIHRSGGDASSGTLLHSNQSRALSRSLWSDEDLEEMNKGDLTAPGREYDYSLSLGGPVLKQIAWYFGNIRFRSGLRETPFVLWTSPTATTHFPFDLKTRDASGLFKMSASVANKFKGALEFGFSRIDQRAYEPELAWNRTRSATRKLVDADLFTGRLGFTYQADQRTAANLSVDYAGFTRPLFLNALADDQPQYRDLTTGYVWGSGSLNEREKSSRLKVGGTLTRVQDRFLGLPHDLVAGGEYESMASVSSVWKADNLIYNYLDGSPYAFGEVISPASGNLVGLGWTGFWIAPEESGGLTPRRELRRLGFFVRDTMRIAGRISLTLGLRFDRSDARFLPVSKGASGNDLSKDLGEALVATVLGFNPYGTFSVGQWDKAIVWNSLSPRVGLSWDLFGTGKTVLKGSYAKMPENLGLGYSQDITPLDPRRSHDFYWYDENGNALVDTGDTFRLFPEDYRVYRPEYYRQAVDPDLEAPMMEEWTAGFDQEVFRDFTLSFRYIDRRYENLVGYSLYDPSTEVPWARLADAPEGWWVPFTTVVPGQDGYPDVPVTLHFRSSTAPLFFERIENVPELGTRYRALEFSFRKRMSHNWQLLGSVAWSRSTGTTGLASPWGGGNAGTFISPNSFIHHTEDARLRLDRPLSARIMGTVRFRWDIYLSLLFRAQSGAPWARTVTIIPPESWALANQADRTPVTVYLEEPGSRRYDPWKTLDLRAEKEFIRGGRARLTVSVDVLNILGEKYRVLDLNDGGSWAPEGEGAGPGDRTLSGTYNSYLPLWGSQSVRFTLALRF